MAVKIRLSRRGSMKKPFYRIVVADREAPRDGRFIEVVGTYNPMVDPPDIKIEADRIRGWLDKGALPTDTVKSLLKRVGFSRDKKTEAA